VTWNVDFTACALISVLARPQLLATCGDTHSERLVEMKNIKTIEPLEGQDVTEVDDAISVEEKSSAPKKLLTLIAQQPFFDGLNPKHLQLLSESAMLIEFEAGHWIFRQGDPANRFYLILDGKVLIESELDENRVVPIRTLGPGDNLGWAWLFPPYYMHFTARALERTRGIFFYGTCLREQCETNHELGYQLMRRIAEIVVKNLNATQQHLSGSA
jgi:CRP/FNR family transcriptional regulator, cyclic AMP receptor protein